MSSSIIAKTPVARIPSEISVEVRYYSQVEEQEYAGIFIVTRPTIAMRQRIGAEKARMLQGHYYDSDTPGRGITVEADFSADITAFLRVCVKDAPSWWDLDKLYDPEIIYEVYKAAASADPFRHRQLQLILEQSARNRENRDSERGNAVVGNAVAALVDEQIYTPGK